MAKRRPRHRPPVQLAPTRKYRGAWIIFGVVLLVGAAAITYWATRGGKPAGRRRGPNILLITLDTTRADYLSCYGSTAQTPVLDRIAREGALFRRCSASAMMTLPSHCSIMTGLYPFVHGVRRNGMDRLPATAQTLAEVLKAAGFATAASVGSYVLDARFGVAQGFDAYHGVPAPSSAEASAERKGDKVCDDGLELLRERAKQRFFLWVHFYDPHYPYESASHPDIQSREAYADEIAFMDGQVGRLLAELRNLGLEHNTLIIVVGDHGEGLEDHQEYQHGFFAYQTCQHVPLMMRGPGVSPGRQVNSVVRTVDVAPTILELAGQPPLRDASGVSLVPLLGVGSPDGDPAAQLRAYAETPEPYTLLRLSTIRTLTAGNWKYVWSTAPQLFDLESDPGELRDVIADQPDRAAALHEELHALLASAPPRIPADKPAALTSDDAARLESLGYVDASDDADPAGPSGLDTFEVKGADPHPYAAVMRSYDHARDAIGRGQFAPAERELRNVLAALPDAPAPQRDLAFTLGRMGRSDEAGQLYERVLAASPADTRARVQYATLLMDRQRWAQAAGEAKQALQRAPDDYAAHMILGAAYENLDRLGEAETHLKAAARLQPAVTTPLLALGQVCVKQKRFAEAATYYHRVLALDPQSALARAALQALERSGRPARP